VRGEAEPARQARGVEREDQAADGVAAEHLDDEAQDGVEAEVHDEQCARTLPNARAEQEQGGEDQ